MSTAASTSSTEPASAEPSGAGARPDGAEGHGRFPAAVDRFAPAIGAYAVVKAVGLGVFMLLLSHTGDFLKKEVGRGGGAQPWDVLGTWDGIWYQRIAENGYNPQLVPVHVFGTLATYHENSAAFFPLYPWLMRLVGAVTGLGPYGSGIAVSVVASFVAAAGIFAIAERLGGFRAGVTAAVIWGLFPGSGVEWAVYSDSLFVAISAWACYCVMTRRWVTAGLLALAAGLNRPTAAALIAAVSIAALVALIRRRDGIARPLTAMLITPGACSGTSPGSATGWATGAATSSSSAVPGTATSTGEPPPPAPSWT